MHNIELTNRVFGQVQLHRINQFYNFLLKVCELIHRNLLITEKTGASKFMDFVQDEHQRRHLFGEFVRNLFRLHATSLTVKREDVYWRWRGIEENAENLLPKMQTDISLTSNTRKVIID